MLITAAMAAAGAVLAFTTIRSDVLESGEPTPEPQRHLTHCAVAGTPLRQTGGQLARTERLTR